MLSKTAKHAVAAVIQLARLRPGAYAGAAEIAEKIGAPPNYLSKLLRTLADAGILESQKGKGGGFRMARDPAKVTLFDVIEPIEHVSRWSGCFLESGNCSEQAPCAVHSKWGPVRDAYMQFLQSTTMAELAGPAQYHLPVSPRS